MKKSGPICRRETGAFKGYWESTDPERFSVDEIGYFPSRFFALLYGLLGPTDIIIGMMEAEALVGGCIR